MTKAIIQCADGVMNNKERVFYVLLTVAIFLMAVYGILIGQATFAAASVDKLNKEMKTIGSDVQIAQAEVLAIKSSITKELASHRGLSEARLAEFISSKDKNQSRVVASAYEL